MNSPPHTVESQPSGLADDRYQSRNNFLMLLLGVISTAEHLLTSLPSVAASDETEYVNPRPAEPTDMLR